MTGIASVIIVSQVATEADLLRDRAADKAADRAVSMVVAPVVTRVMAAAAVETSEPRHSSSYRQKALLWDLTTACTR